jgi:predicted transcriptional regulator
MKNKDAITAFVALGQETRLNIFRLIVQRGDAGLTPTRIKVLLGVPAATLSFHLRELLLANLIWVERDGRSLIYRPNAKFASQLSSFLLENCCSGKDCLTISTKQKAR